jgi:hypothetical protein
LGVTDPEYLPVVRKAEWYSGLKLQVVGKKRQSSENKQKEQKRRTLNPTPAQSADPPHSVERVRC